MPSSGARSGTRPSRLIRGAGDGRVMRRRSLRCGHSVDAEAQPVAVAGGRRWYSCPECLVVVEAR